ncbi:ArsR/SmtB family transcription factor [Streptococcus moroccensis]|uniref:Transcriptional regulator n=1 Tax=Streptococcus moroccensis TaxID=1451356 RepID=A0ABT9YTE8_9STRE|nr:ArsR family transcriptional regulator [Streptococcus moroccensis]MDQ0222410.1 putative transcriptional regulator [Streptococcus moroccensis]
MELQLNHQALPVLKALASDTRIQIIELLSHNKLNLTELSEKTGLSSAIIGRHVKSLVDAGIVKTESSPGKSGLQKVVVLKIDRLNLEFPQKLYTAYETYQQHIPIGHFSDFSVKPTCGLATTETYIGVYDEPKYFSDPRKYDAGILWFTSGFVEYQIPNLLEETDTLEMIDLSLEIASEFPYSNNVWPSDITFTINDIPLGFWTSPGDFSDTRGIYTPKWWPNDTNQYGILVNLRITTGGTYVNGSKISLNGLKEILPTLNSQWKIKLSVEQDSENVGGLTIYGKGFGNHNQHIILTTYFR